MSNQAPNSDEVPPKSSEVEETANPQQEPGEEETADQQTQVGSGFAFFTSLVVFAAIRGENVSHR